MSSDPTPLILSGQFVGLLKRPGYGVSSNGRVWTCRSSGPGNRDRFLDRWKPLSAGMTPMGYLTVSLAKEGKQRSEYVHELILEGFVGYRPEGRECCHQDCDKTNNNLENLRWDTRINNRGDSIALDRVARSENHYRAKLSNAQVEEIRNTDFTRITQTEIARLYGVRQSTISRIRRHQRRRRA